MPTIQKTQEETLVSKIVNFKASRNPFTVFFMLSDLRDIFLSIGESVLSGIEKNYSTEAKQEYLTLLEKYKNQGAFEQIYNHYIHTQGSARFQKALDDYFSDSFFLDLPFFYFTLSRILHYQILFESLCFFGTHPDLAKKYYALQTTPQKQDFLVSSLKEILPSQYPFEKVESFLQPFVDFPFKIVKDLCHEGGCIEFMEKLTIVVFTHKDTYQQIYQLFQSEFLENVGVYATVLEDFQETMLYEVISFLRQRLVSWMHESVVMSFKEQQSMKELFFQSQNIEFMNREEKIDFFIGKEIIFESLGNQKENYARVTLTRKLLEARYSDIVGLTFGISMLSPELFYALRREQTTPYEHLKLFIEVKNLILHIDHSLLLSLLRPFLLRDLSRYFNDGDEKYYIIKYIICIILSENYTEYLKLSKFFFNLETFFRPGIQALIGKVVQFGWVYLLVIVCLFFAPFGVFLAGLIYLVKEGITKLIAQVKPELKMNLNFQIGTFSSLLAVVALIFGSTFGLKDNVALVYDNFKGFINALTLPTNETLTLLGQSLSNSKSDVGGELGDQRDTISLNDIDYFHDVFLNDLKKNPQKDASSDPDIPSPSDTPDLGSDLVDEIFKESCPPVGSNPSTGSKYSHVLLTKNLTFRDYAHKIAQDCSLVEDGVLRERILYEKISLFLTKHKTELLAYFPSSYDRMSVWELSARLPKSYWDLGDLELLICQSKTYE